MVGLKRKMQMMVQRGKVHTVWMMDKTSGYATIRFPDDIDRIKKFSLSRDGKRVTFCGKTRLVARISCWDNGGKSADRYTVIFLDEPESKGLYSALAMSSSPFHPQGVGMHCTARPGSHLGKRVSLESLPADCIKLVERDLMFGYES